MAHSPNSAGELPCGSDAQSAPWQEQAKHNLGTGNDIKAPPRMLQQQLGNRSRAILGEAVTCTKLEIQLHPEAGKPLGPTKQSSRPQAAFSSRTASPLQETRGLARWSGRSLNAPLNRGPVCCSSCPGARSARSPEGPDPPRPSPHWAPSLNARSQCGNSLQEEKGAEKPF